MKKNKLNIIMMGSDLSVQGGVSEVEREYLKAGLAQKVNLNLIPSHIDGTKIDKLLQFARALKSYLLLKTEKPAILHLHLSHGASFYRKLLLMLLAKSKQHKVIMHLHGSDYEDFMYKNRLLTFLTRWVFDQSDHIIVLSKRWESLIRQFSANTHISTLYNPASRLHNPPHYALETRGKENLNILFLGRLGERKGIYDLLQVINKDKAYFAQKKVTFILAGDGDIEKVSQFVTDHQLQSIVEIPGWVSGKQKDHYLKNSHILVLPSYNEQMPMSILEAMAHGYPVLATDIAGIPEMIDEGINGFLFPPGDLEKLSNYLKTLCEDQSLRKQMGLNSQKIIAERFDSQLITEKLIRIYDDTLAHGNIPRARTAKGT